MPKSHCFEKTLEGPISFWLHVFRGDLVLAEYTNAWYSILRLSLHSHQVHQQHPNTLMVLRPLRAVQSAHLSKFSGLERMIFKKPHSLHLLRYARMTPIPKRAISRNYYLSDT